MQKLWNKLEINLIYELDLHQFLELEKKIERLVKMIVLWVARTPTLPIAKL